MCFSNARKKNLGVSFSVLISTRCTWCIVNSCNTTQCEITKHRPGLKPLPKSKCCSRPQSWEHPGPALSCRGVLNPTAFPTQWNSLTHSKFRESTSPASATTMDKEREEGLEKLNPAQEVTHLLKVHFNPLGPLLPKSAGAKDWKIWLQSRKKIDWGS